MAKPSLSGFQCPTTKKPNRFFGNQCLGHCFCPKQMIAKTAIHNFSVVLAKVVSYTEQVQFRHYFFFSFAKEPPKVMILFYDPENAFHLN